MGEYRPEGMGKGMPRTGTRGVKRSEAQRSQPSSGKQAALEGWRGAVQEYVHGYNEAEVERRHEVLGALLEDRDHRRRLEERLRRLRLRDEERGILSPQSETRATLLRINESATEVSVVLKLHVKRHVEHRGRSYTEERLEQERLWLAEEGGAWRLTRVEPIVGERRPRYGHAAADSALAEHRSYGDGGGSGIQHPGAARPFLNYGILPRLNTRDRAVEYRRELVAAYADRWWNEANPAYELFEVNCTNYVSQCVFAGEAPMNYTGKRESGWWYKGRTGGQESWSYSWAVSNALQLYLSFPRSTGMRATTVESASELSLGDVITYDWSGDGRFQHTTVVTAFDADGMPLVNANTVPSRHRYWDYKDSYAWTDRTRYRFYHLQDYF